MPSRQVLIVLSISTMAAMMGVGVLLPILPLYAKDLGASGTMLGIIFASLALTMAVSNPIMGRLSDRFGYKRIISLGLLIHVPVALAYIIATHPHHLIAIRLVEGVLCTMVETVSMAYVGVISPKDREGSYMGIFNTFIYLGLGVGPFLGGILTDLYSIRMPFYVMAAALTLALILVVLFVPEHASRDEASPSQNPIMDGRLLPKLLGSKLMIGMMIYALILSLGQSGLFAFLPLVTQREQMNPTQIGILSSTIMLAAGLLQTPCGYLANRYNKILLVITGVLIVAVDLAFIPWCHNFWSFFILSIIGGTASAICNPAAIAMLVKGAKNLQNLGLGFALGVFNLCLGLGMIVGPVWAGYIMDAFGLDQVFIASAALFIFAACAVYYFTKDLKDL